MSKARVEIQYDATGKSFEDINAQGAKEFPDVWLSCTEAMVSWSTSRIDHTHPAVKELLARVLSTILHRLRNQGVLPPKPE